MDLKCLNFFYMRLESKLDYYHPNGRPYWVLDYYKNKMSLLDSSGNIIESEPSSIYLIPPNTPTQHLSADNKVWGHSTILFEADQEYMDKFKIPYMTPIKIQNTKDIEQLLFDMESRFLSVSDFKQISLDAYLSLILVYINDYMNTYEKDYKTKSGDDLQQIRHHIMNSTHLPWTLKTMATMANMSVRTFQRKYKQIYGTSPISDLYEYRFKKAKRLLDSGFSINHILKSCGFKSPQHFSNFFKLREGITPSEYRKKHQKTQ